MPARASRTLQFNLMACIEDRRDKYGRDLAQQLHLQASRRLATWFASDEPSEDAIIISLYYTKKNSSVAHVACRSASVQSWARASRRQQPQRATSRRCRTMPTPWRHG